MPPNHSLPLWFQAKYKKKKLRICILWYTKRTTKKSTRIGVSPKKHTKLNVGSMLGPGRELQVQSLDLTKLWSLICHNYCGEYQEKSTGIPTTPVHKTVRSSVSSTEQVRFWNAKISRTMKLRKKVKPNIETVSLVGFFFLSSVSLPQSEQLTKPLSRSLAWVYKTLYYCYLTPNKYCHVYKNKVRFNKYIAKARNRASIQKTQSTSYWKSYKQ